eukprot:7736163-Pyramimonas_sp.AAC.1
MWSQRVVHLSVFWKYFDAVLCAHGDKGGQCGELFQDACMVFLDTGAAMARFLHSCELAGR